ncbi:recombination-associated protein RdgC [Desulfovibrio gilichinskyi]|uniref:Putative exonuclease, RdgC n=1 Tax=Desulfovibrio gilichinskyi TaxID=1519643 RepID=A0A1X7EU05_9BACT|nr:recombination-associated protein RdgC [Desulfovibrio gilichinskyi]SMF40118.1 Putative exonuclease, RdgC [Desulfovibrio gilichinskyi]
MPILSASVGLTRYRILEDIEDDLIRSIPNLLVKYAFKDIDNTAEERSFGWVNMDDMLDDKWSVSPPEKGQYHTFSLRLDTRRIQPAVLKKHLQIALNYELEEAKKEGKNFISRDRKREIKDQVTLKLRARSLPIPAVFDVVWNIPENRLYFACTNSKVLDMFEEYFSDTFELTLEPLTPFFLAMEILGDDAAQKLESLDPTYFVG